MSTISKRKVSSKGNEEVVEPLDNTEQDKIVQDLIQEANKNSNTTRKYFYWIYNAIALIFIGLLSYSSSYPMDMSHQQVFESLIPHYVFQVFYALSVVLFYSLAQFIRVSDRYCSM